MVDPTRLQTAGTTLDAEEVFGLAGTGTVPLVLGDLKPDYVDTVRAQYFSGEAAMMIWSTFILDELAGLVRSGALKYRESVAHGLEAAPEAFIGLLAGRNFGKQLVKLD